MYPGGNFVKIPPPEGPIGQGTSTARFLVRNQCRRWPRRPCGQLGVIIFNDDVGKTLFPGGGVSEGCFRGAFQRGVSEGCFRGAFQWGVSGGCFRPSGAILCSVPSKQFCQGFVFPKDPSDKGPAQRDTSSEISAEDVPVGNSACSSPMTFL